MISFKKHLLKNGLRVIFAPMKETQTFTVEIFVGVGSKYEKKEINGISHFLEHMVFKGTKKRPTSKQAMEEIEGVGGTANAFTDKEQTGYYAKVPCKHWEKAVDIVSDIFLNPLLPLKEFEKERGVILQEESMYRDLPMRYVWDVFEELLYGNQPAGRSIIGTTESIKSINRSDLVDYFQKFYHFGSTVLVLAGNFNEEKALKKIKEIFKTKKKNLGKNLKKKVIENQDQPKLKIYKKETDQSHLVLGFRACDMFSEDRFALKIAGVVLGGNMSSRLFDLLREKYGLTYYVGSGMEQTTDTGYFHNRAGVKHENVNKVVKLILNEIKKLKTKKVSQKELVNAKEFIKGGIMMNLESSDEISSYLGNQELFREKISQPEKTIEKINKISAEDVLKMARKYFINKNLNLAIVGSSLKENELIKILKV